MPATEPDPVPRRPVESVRPAPGISNCAPAGEFETFYREIASPLVRFLMLQGASLADAAEIAQDTLESAYRSWDRLESPRAWSFSVGSRALIRRLTSTQEDLTADPVAPSPLLRATPTNAWHLRHELITALAALPLRQRQAMAWTLSGYTPAEIASELHLTSDQVRANLRLARRALAARLTDGQGLA